MDLLYQRYADPFLFIDQMLLFGRFCEFVYTIWKTICEEDDEKKMWEFFLHKVHDKSFTNWKNDLENQIKNENATEADLEATVKDSMNILDGFNPELEGGVDI